MQLTSKFNYMSFAVYEMLKDNPEMQGYEYISDGKVKELEFVFYASNGGEDVENNYVDAIMVAKDLGIDIKKYTDIVDVGKTYVAENYFWKSAGFFWMAEGIGGKIEGLTLDEGMVISTEDINPDEEIYNFEMYKDRLHKTEYIKSISHILEGIQW